MANELTRAAVLAAVAEFKILGRTAFLDKYGFGKARDYYLEIDGAQYDSKAIAGAAYGYLPNGKARGPYELVGGMNDAAAKLIELGFTIVRPSNDPDWTWDEHILALELYMRNPTSPPSKTSQALAEVSAALNRLAARRGIPRTAKFRNPTGVYMKMMNFRRHDPKFQAQGKKGLSRGATQEADVWQRYADDLSGLRVAAKMVLADLQSASAMPADDTDDTEGAEGSVQVRQHKVRERDAALIRAKRAQVLKRTGTLACEVCDFDFAVAFGTHGLGFIEVHHINPMALSEEGRKTKLSELAVVCPNCHRMLHRGGLLPLSDLQSILLLNGREALDAGKEGQ